PNQTLEAGLIGLTYSIKPSIKLPLTIHWGLTASDITERSNSTRREQAEDSHEHAHRRSFNPSTVIPPPTTTTASPCLLPDTQPC
ncbi:hypothetical protein INR49_026643, partial [Caranx melampygus]